jgi:hypothetical protein
MASLTLREAARQVGVSRQTVYRLVKQGRLSATVGHDGQKLVDTAELLRVFGSLTPRQPETVTQDSHATVTGDSVRQPETPPATARPTIAVLTQEEHRRELAITDREALRAELAAARDALKRAEEQLREAKEREAKLLDLAQSATRLLEHREIPAAPPPKGFWRRVFGG